MTLNPADVRSVTLDELEAEQASKPLAYDLDDPDDALSALDQIKKDTSETIAAPTLIRHPGRPQYVLAFRSNIASDEAARIEKRIKTSKTQNRDRSAIFLSGTNTAIYYNGEQALGSDGQPLMFRDPELMAAVEAKTAAEAAIRFFLNNDAHMVAVANAVLEAAGYGTDAEVVTDPTSPV